MRAIVFTACLGLGIILLTGCSTLQETPSVASIVLLTDQSFFRSNNSHTLARDLINFSSDETWQRRTNNFSEIAGLELAFTAINISATPAHSSDIRLQYYVSDEGNLSLETLNNAYPLLEAVLPTAMQSVYFDSGIIPVSPDAKRIIEDGNFMIYITRNPDSAALKVIQARLRFFTR